MTHSGDTPPCITFESFISSLGANALMAMGLAKHPEQPFSTDYALAKEFIDILGILQEKTNGNLTPQEAQLLQELLTDLRMQYVATTKGSAP